MEWILRMDELVLEPQVSVENKQRAEDFYRLIGKALTTWSGVEYHLCLIWATVLGGQPVGALGRSFWAVHSFADRLDMTHAAVKAEFEGNEQIWPAWKAIRKELLKLNERRNEIAHGTVALSATKRDGTEVKAEFAPYFWGALADPKTWRELHLDPEHLPKYKRLSERDLETSNTEFEAMSEPMMTLFGKLYAAKRAIQRGEKKAKAVKYPNI
jgi:hypothetical protein